tara:strand:+ start:6970 stop:7857 length:888 start_codon:yes stop_codon:yes gene_type:complete
MFYILLKLLLIICIYLLIIYKKYDILFFYVIFFLIIVYKFNNIKEGFKNVTIDELSKMNTLLDKLIKLFNTNRNDCIGKYRPQKCDKECGYGSRENIYTIIQQSGETGLPCPHKEGSIKKTKCINDLCNEGDKCINNNDCFNRNCVDGFCKDKYDCSDTYIDYCNTYDKCNSLNSDISDIKYTWTGSECLKEYESTDNYTGLSSSSPSSDASPVSGGLGDSSDDVNPSSSSNSDESVNSEYEECKTEYNLICEHTRPGGRGGRVGGCLNCLARANLQDKCKINSDHHDTYCSTTT